MPHEVQFEKFSVASSQEVGEVHKIGEYTSEEKHPERPPVDGPAFGHDHRLLALLAVSAAVVVVVALNR